MHDCYYFYKDDTSRVQRYSHSKLTHENCQSQVLCVVLHDNFDTHANQTNWYVCSTKCFKWIVSMLYKMSQLLYKQNHLLKKVKKVSWYVKKWNNDYDIYMFTFTQYFFHFELKSCIGFIFSQLWEKFWEDLWIVVDKYIYKIQKKI